VTDASERLQRLVALKVVKDETTRLYAAALKEDVGLTPGSKLMVYSPVDGKKLGAVSMSDPDEKPAITDEKAFAAWAEKTYPDDVEWDFEITGTHEQVCDVLYQHAPNLVKRIAKPTSHFKVRVLEDSQEYGAPVGPAGELDVPGMAMLKGEPRMSCLAAKEALPSVARLMREHLPLELLAGGPEDAA
jgi:hypothetical protein